MARFINHLRNKYKFLLMLLMGLGSLILAVLPWFGIHPPEKPVNIFGKLFKFLFINIPLVWVLLVVILFIIIYSALSRKPKSKETISLSDEHAWFLLNLLDKRTLTIEKPILGGRYIKKYNKKIADLNIIEHELEEWGLIISKHSVHYGEGVRCWKLTGEGIKKAKEFRRGGN